MTSEAVQDAAIVGTANGFAHRFDPGFMTAKSVFSATVRE